MSAKTKEMIKSIIKLQIKKILLYTIYLSKEKRFILTKRIQMKTWGWVNKSIIKKEPLKLEIIVILA